MSHPRTDRLLHTFSGVFHSHHRCPTPGQTDFCTHSVGYSTPITDVPPQDRQTSARIQWGIPLPSQMSHPRTDRLLHAFSGVFHSHHRCPTPGQTDFCTHSVGYSTPITDVPPQDRQTSARIQWGIPLPSQMSHPRTDRLLHTFSGVFHSHHRCPTPGQTDFCTHSLEHSTLQPLTRHQAQGGCVINVLMRCWRQCVCSECVDTLLETEVCV